MNVTITGLPRSDASESGPPFRPVSANAGARRRPACQLAAGVSLTGGAVDGAACGRPVSSSAAATAASTSTTAPSTQRNATTERGYPSTDLGQALPMRPVLAGDVDPARALV